MELREIVSSVGLPLGAAALGSVATASGTRSLWYERLEKPAYQPPSLAFPVAWSVLYTQSAVASGIAQRHMTQEEAEDFRRKLMLNMALNAGWSWTFFRARQLGPYAAWTTFATVLTAGIWRRNRH